MASKKTQKTRSKRSCFQSCFGFSRDVSDQGPKGNIGSARKKKPWFFWSKFRMRNIGSSRKTVPVDAPIFETPTRVPEADMEIEEEIQLVGQEEVTGKRQFTGNSDRVSPVIGPVSGQGVLEKTRKAKYGIGKLQQESHRNPIKDSSISARNDTCNKRSPVYLPFNSRKTVSQPGSPDKNNPNRLNMPRSTSLHSPLGRKSIQPQVISRLSGRKTETRNDPLAGYIDPVARMSVLMVALAILLLWGRICAILCTSAWFYFITRRRTATEPVEVAGKKVDSGNPDIDSDEYKKKVIMEGLLERNRPRQ
ncbi:uncharacterized protein LOC143854565 [Tasmannia lanceolata]|uniref:uncharacterized protein LOC143854565 n=1 Tax=Tasmannia lanceolata TaxID=3420 RepID=UPI004062F428